MSSQYYLQETEVHLKLCEDGCRKLYSTSRINSPDDAVNVLADLLRQYDHELCVVVNLDGANHPINYTTIGIGETTQCPVATENIFRSALLSGAAKILLIHNHPSENPEPSPEDRELTQRLAAAGHVIGIPLMEHVIVAGPKMYSFYRDARELLIDF